MIGAVRLPSMWVWIAATVSVGFAAPAFAQPHCPHGELPAYAHNDYNNKHPLYDAIAFGYRGVEADVFLVNGVLRVAHDRKAAQNGPALDTLYLLALRDVFNRCSRSSEEREGIRNSFWLNIEIKEWSPETIKTLRELLKNYADLFRSGRTPDPASRVLVTIVGDNSTIDLQFADGMAGIDCKLNDRSAQPQCLNDPRVRMLSLDYGKTIGRWWTLESQRVRWLSMLRAAKLSAPQMVIRAYNVPPRVEIYEELRRSGVDLIGIKNLQASQPLLLATSGRSLTPLSGTP